MSSQLHFAAVSGERGRRGENGPRDRYKVTAPVAVQQRNDHSKRETKSTEKTVVKLTKKALGGSKKIKPLLLATRVLHADLYSWLENGHSGLRLNDGAISTTIKRWKAFQVQPRRLIAKKVREWKRSCWQEAAYLSQQSRELSIPGIYNDLTTETSSRGHALIWSLDISGVRFQHFL